MQYLIENRSKTFESLNQSYKARLGSIFREGQLKIGRTCQKKNFTTQNTFKNQTYIDSHSYCAFLSGETIRFWKQKLGPKIYVRTYEKRLNPSFREMLYFQTQLKTICCKLDETILNQLVKFHLLEKQAVKKRYGQARPSWAGPR